MFGAVSHETGLPKQPPVNDDDPICPAFWLMHELLSINVENSPKEVRLPVEWLDAFHCFLRSSTLMSGCGSSRQRVRQREPRGIRTHQKLLILFAKM